jgi:enoyl-CoA hydratase/carnithine racemase
MINVTTENLKCEMAAEHVAVFTISRPRSLNAMLLDFLKEAHELMDSLEADESVRCVILTGAGEKSFSAGGDLKEEMANAESNRQGIIDYNRLGDELCLKIRRSRLPFIAAVNGYAFGAPLGLIAACDLSIASDNALFGLPTPSLGGIPGWGCTQTVTRCIGAHQVKRMLLTNERFDAREALRSGLVSKVVPQADLRSQALAAARQIAGYAPSVMAIVKKTVNDGLEATTVEAALALEHANLSRCNLTPIFVEGIAAFLEKRKPDFDGAAAKMKK